MGRHMDFGLRSNQLIIGLTAITAVASVVVWLSSGELGVLWAPVHVFVTWSMIREVDPDHPPVALIGALVAGVWVLAGVDVVGVLAVGGLMVAARLVSNTTGRRPLTTDLVVIVAGATAISFTAPGWVAGFSLAVAIYVDDRMSGEPTTAAAITAAIAALGASGVATLAGAFPREVPEVRPLYVVAIGVLALMAVVREPTPPTSLVDSRLRTILEQPRLHASRSLFAVGVFAISVLMGPDTIATGVIAIALALVLVSNEVERIRRGR